MQADEIRFLFAYDRWATREVLAALDGLDQSVWMRTDVVGEWGLGAILVHHPRRVAALADAVRGPRRWRDARARS